MGHLVSNNGGESTITIYEDNQGSLSVAKNPEPKAKHIDIQHHFVQEKVADGVICLENYPTGEMLADILTKPLTRVPHGKLRNLMWMV